MGNYLNNSQIIEVLKFMHSGLYFAHSTLLRCIPALLTESRVAGRSSTISFSFGSSIRLQTPRLHLHAFHSHRRPNVIRTHPIKQPNQTPSSWIGYWAISYVLYKLSWWICKHQVHVLTTWNTISNFIKTKKNKKNLTQISRRVNLRITDFFEPRRNISDWSINSVRKK